MKHRGFKIKKSLDCWGDYSYFVFDSKGCQMFDAEDTVTEAKEKIDLYLSEKKEIESKTFHLPPL